MSKQLQKYFWLCSLKGYVNIGSDGFIGGVTPSHLSAPKGPTWSKIIVNLVKNGGNLLFSLQCVLMSF